MMTVGRANNWAMDWMNKATPTMKFESNRPWKPRMWYYFTNQTFEYMVEGLRWWMAEVGDILGTANVV